MKRISIVTPCYNEEENVAELYRQVKEQFARLPQYSYEHLFIDNASQDRTVAILREIASEDKNVKVIINTRNFGHIRSGTHALLQARGDAVIFVVADLQDPTDLLPEFLKKWEEGYRCVLGIKEGSLESPLMFAIRKLYYDFINRMAEIRLIKNFAGFGLYDQSVVQKLREIDDPYPYLRGLIAEIGHECFLIPYQQPMRRRGIKKTFLFAL